jgi:GT2 family glycosyltransferase
MEKTAAVILTYNRKKLLCRCIDAVTAQKDVCFDILVADGGSTDGTEALFGAEGKYPEVIYYDLGANMGSAGFYYAIRKAVTLGYENLWLMDDDVIPDETALKQLLRADRYLEGRWGFLVSLACWKDGSLCRANIPKTAPLRFVRVSKKRNLIPVKMASWASIMIKAETVRKAGLPIKEYYIGTEDYEYTARISRRFPSYWVTASRVLHAKDENIKADIIKARGDRLERFYYLYRNDVHFYRKYGLQGHVYLVLKFVYTFFRIILFEKGNRNGKIKILIKGYADGFSFDPKPEKYQF